MDQVIIIRTNKSGQKRMWFLNCTQKSGSGEITLFINAQILILKQMGEPASPEEFRTFYPELLDSLGTSI